MNFFETKALQIEQTSDYGLAWRRADRPLIGVQWFVYAQKVTIAGGAHTETATLKTRQEFDFVCSQITLYGPGYGLNAPTMQVVDLSTGRAWFNRPAALTDVFGIRCLTLNLPAPRFIAPLTDLQFIVSVPAVLVNPLDVYFTLLGKRIYYGGSA